MEKGGKKNTDVLKKEGRKEEVRDREGLTKER